MNENGLSKTLSRLLFEKNIRPTELARLTNVPQPTIQRIVAGTTSRPHVSSLEPIANFFSISVDQLKGLQPISWLQAEADSSPGLKNVPILNWSQISQWLDCPVPEQFEGAPDSIISDTNLSPKAFALTIKDSSMEPVFSIGTTIIVDPNRELKDRRYVVVKLANSNEAVFRQLIMDATDFYIKPLSPDLTQFKMHKLDRSDTICGILVQAKRNFDD
jgi:SOS-response transcriptional repressor LexA